ncbi:hypothetical protein PABG_11923 [Paracoccidioides brasiliensis Pb03]|nr:hypothetical protein PABG_11923 [Paracoccidioides brasiliensis Pb03]
MQHINNVLCPDQMLNAIRVRRRSIICTSKRVEDDRRAEFLRHELESRSGGQESTQNVCTSAGSLAMTPQVDVRNVSQYLIFSFSLRHPQIDKACYCVVDNRMQSEKQGNLLDLPSPPNTDFRSHGNSNMCPCEVPITP